MNRFVILFYFIFLPWLISVHAQQIDTFQYSSNEEAGTAWRSIAEAPAVQLTDDHGLTFPIPFQEDRDRVYWDLDGQWDFSGSTGFELDLSCDEPQAMRSLSLYFRSGTGWYIWNQPLSAAGRQKLILSKGQFSIEGTPAGWDKIDKVRVSPWKGRDVNTELTFYRLTGRRDSLYLIQATVSATNNAERSMAQRTTDRLSRWLKQSGVPHAIATEEQLTEVAGGASLIVLPYNPKITPEGFQALKEFSGRSGKIVTFFSSDESLAELMHVRLGETASTRDIGLWRGIQLTSDAPSGIPTSVHQQSWQIGPAFPASEDGSVIAWWMNAAGNNSTNPAIISTSNGFWFTHVLLDDDTIAKQRLLSGLLASLEPSLWKQIAEHSLLNAGRIDGWANTTAAAEALNKMANEHPNGDTIRAFTRRIGIHDRNMRDLYSKDQFREVAEKGYELTDLLIKTYGLAQSSVDREFRGVWDHDGTGWFPGDWDRTAKMMADSGINAIFINATWAGLAHYPSKVLPSSYTFRFYGDQLAQCIQAAKKYDIEVHAWIVCWYLENAPVEFTTPLKNTDRLQRTSTGTEKLWMNPAHPDNVQHHLDVIAEILSNYAVDGIHLDYIRYPGSEACFSTYTRQQFEQSCGLNVPNWPQDVLTAGPVREAFINWRAGTITSFVKKTRELANMLNPSVRLSAAVWGGYPQTITSIGQDWGSWMRDGLLDFVTPMNYANELYRFTALVDQQLLLPGTRDKLFPGIGVTANESQLRGDQVVEQINALRQRGVGGFMLFDLSQTLVDDTLPTLRMGLTKP